jgi:hypothetical protein
MDILSVDAERIDQVLAPQVVDPQSSALHFGSCHNDLRKEDKTGKQVKEYQRQAALHDTTHTIHGFADCE